jgi:hypothetical protein
MGLEFIRGRSKGHSKAQSREYHRAGDDLLVSADQPRRSLVFLANVVGAIDDVAPDTELLLQANGDHIDCFFRSNLVAVVSDPPASWLARVAELPEGICAGRVEERHRDAGKIKVRITL